MGGGQKRTLGLNILKLVTKLMQSQVYRWYDPMNTVKRKYEYEPPGGSGVKFIFGGKNA